MKNDKLDQAREWFQRAKETESPELHKLYLELAIIELLEKTNGKS